MVKNNYHIKLKNIIDLYINLIYDLTKSFPKEEIYGVTSQLRRAALSIMHNYIEGYGRRRKAVLKNFLEISYGSAKECQYLTYFSYKRNYLSKEDYKKLNKMIDEICKMLWGIINKL